MNKGLLKGIFVLVVIVAIGVTIGWLSGRGRGKQGKSDGTNTVAPIGTQPNDMPPEDVAPVMPVVQPSTGESPTMPLAQVPTNSPTVLTNWEEKLDEILASEAEENIKARQMAELFPQLPEEGQVEVAQHLSNLVPDEEYGLISGFLKDASLPEEVLDVLIADSLNRPNAVKLPLLLDVAKDQNNPKATEAREILELFLEEDYGNDWATWQTKLQEWIANNPD